MNSAFTITGLVKFYPDFTLGPLDMDLEPGIVLGFVGPNGAGKTTTINCLSGLVQPERGNVTICGYHQERESPSWKQNIGFMGEERPFFENWSGDQNLKFISKLYPEWDNPLTLELAGRVELDLEKKVRDLSKGNRVKLGLVAALAHSPKLLLFDEPTEGLDPVVRTESLDVIREYMEDEERAVFYSTHVLGDISRLADELAFIDKGKVFLRERTDVLTEQWRQILFRLQGDCPPLEAVSEHRREEDEHRVTSSDFQRTIPQLKEFGAADIHLSPLGIDEISIAIIKGINRSTEDD